MSGIFLAFPFDRITVHPHRLSGVPCIRGYSIAAQEIVDFLTDGGTAEEFLANAPQLELADIEQALALAEQEGDVTLSCRLDRLTVQLGKRGGKPCIRGFRLTAEDVADAIAAGVTTEDLMSEQPDLELEDIRQVLEFFTEPGADS